MKKILLVLSFPLLLACAPPRPPIYVITKSSAEKLQEVRNARFEIKSFSKVDLRDFKRAFVKKYGSEDAFIQGFQKDLEGVLTEGTAAESPTFVLDLQSFTVDSETEGYWTTMMVGAGPTAHPQQVYHSNEFCTIFLDYQVRDAAGQIFLDGSIKERTGKGAFFTPNQSKLASAVEGVRKHLVDYLRGHMPAENIAAH